MQGYRYRRHILLINITPETAILVLPWISYILAPHRIISDVHENMPEGLLRRFALFNDGIAEPLIPEGAGPVHHPVIAPGELGLDELHDAGYGFPVFEGPYVKMEMIIHYGIADQFKIIFFDGHIEYIKHQFLHFFCPHE
jgi:hypothetical protein